MDQNNSECKYTREFLDIADEIAPGFRDFYERKNSRREGFGLTSERQVLDFHIDRENGCVSYVLGYSTSLEPTQFLMGGVYRNGKEYVAKDNISGENLGQRLDKIMHVDFGRLKEGIAVIVIGLEGEKKERFFVDFSN